MSARNTAPGGYCEFIDLDVFMSSPDNSLEVGSAIQFQNTEVIRLLKDFGTEPQPGKYLEGYFNFSITRRILPLT